MITEKEKMKVGAVIGLAHLVASDFLKICNQADEYFFEYWIESELSMIYSDLDIINHVKKKVAEAKENLRLLHLGISKVYDLATPEQQKFFDCIRQKLIAIKDEFDAVISSKEYLDFIGEKP